MTPHDCHTGCDSDNCGVQYTQHFYDGIEYDTYEDEDFS